jgi:hypothetical protein
MARDRNRVRSPLEVLLRSSSMMRSVARRRN